jgi:signal peptidase I
MRQRPGRIVAAVVALSAVVVLWVFFAPTKLGGSASYTVTDGISMHPLLYTNDLAVVRSQSSYQVGQVVLYNSAVLHRPVLHQIILIQNGDYYFKGDNNSFVDPGYATRAELVGKLWFHIPEVGAAISWFGKPAHTGLIAGLTALGVGLASAAAPIRRRRKRQHGSPAFSQELAMASLSDDHGATSDELAAAGIGMPASERRGPAPTTPIRREARPLQAPDPDPRADGPTAPGEPGAVTDRAPGLERRGGASESSGEPGRSPGRDRRSGIAMTPDQVAARRRPRYFEEPGAMIVALGAIFVIAALLIGIGFSRPLRRTEPLVGAYSQTGAFSYSAAVKTATPVYPSGFVKTGQPIYPNLVNTVTMTFHYALRSALPHDVHGTIGLRALLLSQTNTWQQLSTLKPTTAFNGDRVTITDILPLSGLYTLINKVSAQSGAATPSYTADIQPVVHIEGDVDGKAVSDTFQPVLPFSVTENVITMNDAIAPAPPGATYALPSAAAELAAATNSSEVGSIPHQVANVISVAKYEVPVPFVRVLGLVFAGLALTLALAHDQVRRRQTRRSDEELIAARFHSVIVPVLSLGDSPTRLPIDIGDFSHLARLAQFLERPVLYEVRGGERTYAVDDDLRRYLYRPDRTVAAEPVVARAPSDHPAPSDHRVHASTVSPPRQRARRVAVLRGVAGIVVLGMTATLVTSFTATTNVSPSHVGAKVESRTFAEITPPGCGALSLTSVVQSTGGNFVNTASHALVLGTSGYDAITDHGIDNCIVGGASKDVINGVASDICITGPTTGATYSACSQEPYST